MLKLEVPFPEIGHFFGVDFFLFFELGLNSGPGSPIIFYYIKSKLKLEKAVALRCSVRKAFSNIIKTLRKTPVPETLI